MTQVGHELDQRPAHQARCIASADAQAQEAEKLGHLAARPALAIEPGQAVQELGLDRRHGHQVYDWQGADPGRSEGIADDVGVGGAGKGVAHPGVAAQAGLKVQGRDLPDGRPKGVESIVGRLQPVLRQGQVDRHP